ncbi:MAG: hypothetical protein K0Q92_621 [Steroidobacteraceae bacterium]|jgi:hypothetical protein|nr:hypothetical protein [Steroidobacteraceae bacterium]
MTENAEWLIRQLQISRQWGGPKPRISFVRTANDIGVWMCRNGNGWPRIQRFGESPGSAYRAWATALVHVVYATPRIGAQHD